MAVLAVVFAVASLGASALLRPHRPNRPKLSAYESGNDPVRLPGGERFSVKFYVVAMLFIIFDIETIFLFPWAVTFRQLGLFGLIEMAVFIGLVFVAYVYIWKKGGLDWSAVPPDLRDEEDPRAGPASRNCRTRVPSVPVERVEDTSPAGPPRRSRTRSARACC